MRRSDWPVSTETARWLFTAIASVLIFLAVLALPAVGQPPDASRVPPRQASLAAYDPIESRIEALPIIELDPAAPRDPALPPSDANADSSGDPVVSLRTPRFTGRPGVFQRIDFSAAWLPSWNNDDDFGVSDLELSSLFGLPAPTRESPLLIKPAFAVHYLDGPVDPDLPPRVYDAWVDFRWMRRLSPRWAADVAVRPGVYSDFESGDGDAFRITGRGFAVYDWSESLKLILGAAYLDRQDVAVLPAAGLIWTPSDDVRWELVMPVPRVARRLRSTTGPGAGEDWIYLKGEFGGGVWSIVRSGNVQDRVTVRDYRVLLGVEKVVIGGLGRFFEAGYVFGRALEFDSETPDFRPDDTLIVRGGVSY